MSPSKSNIWILLFFCTLNLRGLCSYDHAVDVGMVVDMESWVGKSIHNCISLAASDFYARKDHSYTTKIVLHARDSKGDPLQAMSNVLDLLNSVKVSAIIGPDTYIGSKLVASLTDETKVPIFTFAGKSSTGHPYLFQIKEDEYDMARGISTLVELYKWRDVIFIYEDNDHGPEILEYLFESFQDKNIRITYRSAISPSATNDQVIEVLHKLMSIQTTIIIVHVSPSLASSIFLNAKMLGMMSKEYAWILTQKTTEILHSTNFQVIESIQGAIAFRSYIPTSSRMHNLIKRWHKEFDIEVPPTLAIWAYDLFWALAESVERVGVPQNSSLLLSEILKIEYKGASGEFRLSGNKLVSNGFEIINTIDFGERKVGYWTVLEGIRRAHVAFHDEVPHSSSNIEEVIWPGGFTTPPKGWLNISQGKTLRIGVRTGLNFKYFVDAYYDAQKNETSATGFSVDVFNTCIHALAYEIRYEFIPFPRGSYDDLINKVYNQELDGILGDSTILASRSQYVDFTTTYTDVGIGTLTRIKEKEKEKDWWVSLKKRMDVDLWLTYAVFGILALLPILAIVATGQEPTQSSPSEQIGTIMWLIIFSIFFAQRETLSKNVSRFMIIVWFVVVIVLLKSYTGTQTSLFTVEQIEFASKRGIIGFHGGSFFGGVSRSNLKLTDNMQNPYYSYEDYADALSKGGKQGGADAIIDEVPYLKMFLGRNPDEYAMVVSQPITSGFGFIFAKGSPLVKDMSREIARIREDGTLMKLEKKWFGKELSLSSSMIMPQSINLIRFWGVFIVIGVTLGLALTVSAMYLVRVKMEIGTIISFLAGQSLMGTITSLWYRQYPNIINWPMIFGRRI